MDQTKLSQGWMVRHGLRQGLTILNTESKQLRAPLSVHLRDHTNKMDIWTSNHDLWIPAVKTNGIFQLISAYKNTIMSTNWLITSASVSIYTVSLWINVVIDDLSLLNLAFIWLIRVKYRDYLSFRVWNWDLVRLQLLILGSIGLTIRMI